MSFLWRRGRSTPRDISNSGSSSQAQAYNDTEEDEIQELGDGVDLRTLHPHVQGPTLLPGSVARIVSGVTGVSSFYVRASAKIGGWGLAAGREATLKSLEVSRAVVETVLLATGRDTAARATGDLGRIEAENLLEKSISTLHSAISTVSFVTSLGFQSTQTIVDSVSTLSIHGLGALNAILGSTESSRAVAAIITMIKNELNRPDTATGEVASYLDLLTGTVAFVLLQRWGRRKTELEFREAGGEEVIWDTVIDDKGFRADVVATNKKGLVTATKNVTRTRADSQGEQDDDLVLEKGFEVGQSAITLSTDERKNLSDEEIRDRIIGQLPPGARATITTETMTLKKVTVRIHEGETANIEPPPGLTMVSESLTHHHDESHDPRLPQQTIVFRTSLTRSSSAEITPSEKLRITSIDDEGIDPGEEEEEIVMMKSTPSPRATLELDHDRGPTSSLLEKENPLPHLPLEAVGPVANVKKSRRPVVGNDSNTGRKEVHFPIVGAKKDKDLKQDGGGVIKKALKSLSQHNSFADLRQPSTSGSGRRQTTSIEPMSPLSTRLGQDPVGTKRSYAPSNALGSGYMRSTSPMQTPMLRRDPSTSYFSMHEKKRESTISQTDSFSIHSIESRPSSPNLLKTHTRSFSGISKTRSQTEISHHSSRRSGSHDRERHHRRSNSNVPSLYSMATKHSDEAIILAPKTPVQQSMFEDHKMLTALATDGVVPGMFPQQHLVRVIRRFARFATASYGNNFLRVMGLWSSPESTAATSTDLIAADVHHEHNSFSTHTGLPADCILLSSFFDANGAADAAHLSSAVISPLAHFVSADHDSKAIVLTCRGTLGFEDVLTDMSFDYDDLHWRGQTYRVHKGIHAAARRLLSPLGNRVMHCIKYHLEVYQDYGLVLCGHSLGGAVAAILAILLSEPTKAEEVEATFVTASLPKLVTDSSKVSSSPFIALPKGRPIHAYAFGSPAAVSSALRLATRGLVTTVINSNDVVPTLSLGTLQDTRSVALHLKQDANGQLVQLRSRILNRIRDSFLATLRTGAKKKGPPPPEKIAGDGLGEDNWAWTELESIRSHMKNEKLLPPGECFVIETSRVFDRLDPAEGFASPGSGDGAEDTAEARYFRSLGRAATRVQFKLIRDVERRFAEVRFESHMFGHHSPGMYEAALSALEKGVCED